MIDGNQALLNYHIRGNNLNANQVLCNLLVATGIFLFYMMDTIMVKVKTLLSLVYLTPNREKSYEGVNFCCYEI